MTVGRRQRLCKCELQSHSTPFRCDSAGPVPVCVSVFECVCKEENERERERERERQRDRGTEKKQLSECV